MKLKTAIEYWEHLIKIYRNKATYREFLEQFIKLNDEYIQFLKQPLQLGFFVPCDKDGKPLEKPEDYQNYLLSNEKFGMLKIVYDNDWFKLCKEYQQACDRVLFEGFELYQDTYFNSYNCVIRSSDMVIVNIENKTIEDIAPLQVDLVEKVCKQFKY